jgi:hypothetical protein
MISFRSLLGLLALLLAPAFPALAQTNLALNRPVTVSSSQAGLSPEAAVDGNPGTRWGSNWNEGEWISVDLGSAQSLTQVVLDWEGAYPVSYPGGQRFAQLDCAGD